MKWRRAWLLALGTLWLAAPLAASGAADLAQARFDAGQYPEAIRLLQSGLKSSPQDARLHHWLGRCYYELRDFDNAIHSAERAVSLAPGNSEYRFWLGQAYGGKADRERSPSYARKTREAFEEAVRLDGRNLTARRALVDFHAQASWIVGGSKKEARRQVEAIAALDAVQGVLARAYYLWRGEEAWAQAAAEYRKLFDLKPASAAAYFEAADFYRKSRDVAGIRAATDAAAPLAPSDARLSYYRGVMHAIAGDNLAEGERQLLAYVKSPPRSDYPDHASAHEWLGKLYEKAGQWREAAESYRKALQLEPQLQDAKNNLKRLKP